MFSRQWIISLCLLALTLSSNGVKREAGRDDFYLDVFPDDFQWGFATASYQIEGAWNTSGKGVNVWDTFAHKADSIVNNHATGDVAADSYHRYKEDVQALKETGADFYRFSISWSRLFPDGTNATVNQAGIDYYNALIDELLANGITPFVTLYHWDLPQPLQDRGGWPNEETAFHYAEYARLCFKSFGDRVKKWITFNEIAVFCNGGYGSGYHAPGVNMPGVGHYQCAHTVLKAHGLAYRIYDAEFRATQKGEVGVTLDCGGVEPADRNNADDVAAMHRALKFSHGWLANPLYKGDYPEIMKKMIAEKSAAEGRNSSRLPEFDENWSRIIKGTLDFLGLNHYSTVYIKTAIGNGDADTTAFNDPDWPASAANWLNSVPWGFRRLLNWLAMEYGNVPLYVTENGWADKNTDGLNDAKRVEYYKLYINEMLKAVKIDGVRVKGYTAWSLLDNFEWSEGYSQRFGVYYVDIEHGNLTRIAKDSAKFLTQVIRDNGFPSK